MKNPATDAHEIAAQDQLWLHMDRPNNLMIVRALMWLDEEPDWSVVEQVLTMRLVERYPVFSQRPVSDKGHWKWVKDENFSLGRHLTHTSLTDADGEALRKYVGAQFAVPLPRDRPLWKIEVIHGVTDMDGKERPVLLSSFHHSVADGIRLVQVTLGLCDDVGDAMPKIVGRGGDEGRHPLIDGALAVVRRGVSDGFDLGLSATKASLSLPVRTLQALVDPNALKEGVTAGIDLLVNPSNVIDLIESLTKEDNATVNTGSELTRLLSASAATKTSWSGVPSQAKQVAWASDLPLPPLKEAARRHQGTVNDAMIAVISMALSAYLHEHDSLVEQIQWLVPVSIQPLDAELPAELGNHFALVYLEMPLGMDDPGELFTALQQRMLRIKHSAVPVLTSGLQWLVAESPKQIAVALTNFFANKGTGVLTNVPGPRAPISFAGVVVSRMLGWAPASGDQPLCLCIYSYNGTMSIGVSADAELVPDPERIAELIKSAYDDLVATD